MKQIGLATFCLLMALTIGNARAETATLPAQGSKGLNIALSRDTLANQPVDFMINGKIFIEKDLALMAGFGLNFIDTGAAGNSNYSSIGFKGGVRKYLKNEQLATFIGGNFQYVSTRDATGTIDITGFRLVAEAGAEYFLSRQFSLEGSVSFGYLSADLKPVAGGGTSTMSGFGTSSAVLSANFYF